MLKRKRPRPAVSWSWSKAFAGTGHPGDVRLVPTGVERRPRSHRMKFCVQRGLGRCPQQASGEENHGGIFFSAPVCINTGIACLFSPKMKRTSERIVKFHSLAQFVSNFFDNSVSSFTVSWV